MKKVIIALGAAAMLCLSANLFAQEEQKPLREKTNLTFSQAVKDPETKQPTGEFKARWPFVTPASKEVTKTTVYVNEEFTANAGPKRNDFEVKILSTKGVSRDVNGLFMGGQGSYIEFPAKENMALRYIRLSLVDPANVSKLQVVYTESGEVVKGGDEFKEKDGRTYFKISPKLNSSVRLVFTADDLIQFRYIATEYREPSPKK